ncbi:unnamed protein product [Orchesella dallaii]|uniref:PI-PLC X domain-containing protein 3 n=1 Tax=Orchesella dallaii TaxID=48710 RepID=A0ABP1R5Z7_9HEXA
MKDPCFLGYWIAYIRVTTTADNGTTTTKVLKSNCLKLHPFWMAELGETIGDLPVTSLIIPGTHNSGSWEKYKGVVSEINPLSAYEITQEESIYDQLMHGIRYLDVRVSYHSILPINFWVSHELLPQIPLTSLLSDVQRFVGETGRKEIVFVDFHRFHSGINRPEIHTQLIHLVDSYLGSFLVPYNQPVGMLTPNQLWNGGNGSRTVFVTYPEPLIRKQYSFLWPPFQHSWANTNNISQLEKFLGEDLQVFGCRGRFWTLMTELTATASDVLTRPQLGLRGMAQDANRNVTLWFRRKAWYSRAMAIASDFFLGNNLIEMAIKANAHRAVCNLNDDDKNVKGS